MLLSEIINKINTHSYSARLIDIIKIIYLKKLGLNKNYSRSKTNVLTLFILTIKYSKTNTRLILSNIEGRTIFSKSAGQINLKGRAKKTKRILIINKLLKQLVFEYPEVKTKPIVLHLYKTGYSKKTLIRILMKNCFIIWVKDFNQGPYNGCRPSQIPNKKRRTKKFKNKHTIRKNSRIL